MAMTSAQPAAAIVERDPARRRTRPEQHTGLQLHPRLNLVLQTHMHLHGPATARQTNASRIWRYQFVPRAPRLE